MPFSRSWYPLTAGYASTPVTVIELLLYNLCSFWSWTLARTVADVDRARGMDHLVKSIKQAERCITDIIQKRGRHIKAGISTPGIHQRWVLRGNIPFFTCRMHILAKDDTLLILTLKWEGNKKIHEDYNVKYIQGIITYYLITIHNLYDTLYDIMSVTWMSNVNVVGWNRLASLMLLS